MEIIGGPAIRRTQPDAVYIWLVLDTNPSQITITVSTNQNLSTPVARSQSEPDNIVKVGENIFICLVKVTPDNGTFLNDIKLYYDISINDQTLSDFGLLEGDNSIVYGADTLPSFFIPTKHSNILHGSCRKPHAANKSYHSQFDHMRTADNLLNTAIDKLDSRPSMLCLTGDQIYADDVALPLLCALKDEAKRYIGWTEELPHAKDNRKTVIPDAINLCGRKTCSSLHNSPSGVMRQMLDLLTTKERSVFNREKTPYLYPTNISEFLNGHTNISHIQYSSGQAIKNSYVFFDPNKGKKYKWNYNLKNYQTVNLT